MSNNVSQKTKDNILVVFFLILFFPLGLYFMWKKTHWHKAVKWIITVPYALFVLLIIISIATSGNQQTASSNNAKVVNASQTAKSTATPTTKSVVVTKTNKPTPAPTDPCSKYAGTDQMQSCVQLENAVEAAKEPKLNATVQVSDQALVVTNNDKIVWQSCDVTIGNSYELGIFSNYSTIQPGQTEYIPWGSIVKDDGTRFDYATMQPNNMVIECSIGKTTKRWSN